MTFARLEFSFAPVWRKQSYTTDPPRYVPYDVWCLDVSIECTAPIRLVTLFAAGPALGWRNVADRDDRGLTVRFGPRNWLNSDDVFMFFGGHQTWVTDRQLKEDPKPHVTLGGDRGMTGEIVTLAEVPRFDIRFEIIAFAREDTETRRNHRWRVKPQHQDSLPERLRGLTSGRQHSEAIFKQLGR